MCYSVPMKHIWLLIPVLFLASPALAQEDECLLQLDSLTPVMENSTSNLDKEALSLTETTQLEDGTKITYTAGGCAHYAFDFTFENIPGGVPAEPDDPFAYALALLDRAPLKDTAIAEILQRSLKEQQEKGFAAFENNKTEFSCGDAFCALELAPEHVTIGYDFAM